MNPFAIPPACEICGDIRMVTTSVKANRDLSHVIPCPRCGADPHPNGPESKESAERYDTFRRARYQEQHPAPTISQLDLTEAELVTYNMLKAEHPKVSKATLLTWMEGQRYDPAKDTAFMERVEIELEKWRARP